MIQFNFKTNMCKKHSVSLYRDYLMIEESRERTELKAYYAYSKIEQVQIVSVPDEDNEYFVRITTKKGGGPLGADQSFCVASVDLNKLKQFYERLNHIIFMVRNNAKDKIKMEGGDQPKCAEIVRDMI